MSNFTSQVTLWSWLTLYAYFRNQYFVRHRIQKQDICNIFWINCFQNSTCHRTSHSHDQPARAVTIWDGLGSQHVERRTPDGRHAPKRSTTVMPRSSRPPTIHDRAGDRPPGLIFDDVRGNEMKRMRCSELVCMPTSRNQYEM